MQLTIKPIKLRLRTPFHIAHGVSTTRDSVLVYLEEGVGEGAIMPYYDYTQADVVNYLENLDIDMLLADGPLALESALDKLPPGPSPALNAIDIALHDLWAKRLGYPLYQLWGLQAKQMPPISFTISITQDERTLRKRIQSAKAFSIIKLKLGTGNLIDDETIVHIAREETNVHLCVDANNAWTVEQAAQIIPRLAQYDLLFIEQPLPKDNVRDWHRLRALLPNGMPALIADESVQTSFDILALAGVANGINIKLTKAGGLREARRMITLARALNMIVMLGCSIESSVGITAAAHLAPLVDYADLDGNLDVINDPYIGAKLEDGILHLPEKPGLGIAERRKVSNNVD